MGEFRIEVALRDGLKALRRFGWLMAALMLSVTAFEASTHLLLTRWQFTGTDWSLVQPAVTVLQWLALAVVSGAIYLLTFAGARDEPLQPLALMRRLASALPVIILVELTFRGPGALAVLIFQGSPAALGAINLVSRFYQLGLFLTLCMVVPLVLDQRLGLSGAVERSLWLTSKRRWPLFASLMILGLLSAAVILITRRLDPQGGMLEVWYLYIPSILIRGIEPVVIASVYLEASREDGARARDLADTFA